MKREVILSISRARVMIRKPAGHGARSRAGKTAYRQNPAGIAVANI